MSNLSQEKRLRMLNFLNTIKVEHKENDEILKAIHEIENELVSKRYGLIWEKHEENVEILMRTHIPVFTEVKDKEIVGDIDDQKYNFLLEGENLHSLKLLEKTHKGKIDLIYIDPPYNTGGKDFTYDDKYIDENDGYRHSKWLSFMSDRLSIMQRLLTDSGVIFISIGEQEVSNLRLLCDEIFGEQNYITIFSRQMKSGGAKGKYYTPNIDYVLTYAKNVLKLPHFKAIMTQKQIDTFYNKIEKEGKRAGEAYGEERLFKASLDPRPNQRYYIQCPDGSFAIPPGIHFPHNLVEGETVLPTNEDKVWKWIYPRYQQELLNNNIVFKKTKTSGLLDEHGNQSKWNIYNKLWLSEQKNKGVVPSNFITEFENRQSASEMKDFGINFTYAKPSNLIKYLITIANQPKDSLILDCFAGSGTTGHAVLKLNEEDGGNRHFILCTNDENSICNKVTYPRLQKVIKGYLNAKKKAILGIKANLKYYRTDFIEKRSEEISEELLRHIKEMVQLEHGIKIDNNKYHIILTDEDADRMEAESENYTNCKAIYISKNVLLTGSQIKLFNNVDINTIPDYYFENELREVGEIW